MSNNFFYDIKKLFGKDEKQKLAEDASWGMAEDSKKVKDEYDSELNRGEIDMDRLKKLASNYRTEKEKEEKKNAFEAEITHDQLKSLRDIADYNPTDEKQFVKYVMSFYGPGGIYDMGAKESDVLKAVEIYKKDPQTDFAGDTVDRENIRDILLDKFGYEWIDEAEEKADKDYDGDGEIESAKDEVWGSRAKAAAKAGKPFSEADEMSSDFKMLKRLAKQWQNGDDTAYEKLNQMGYNISDDSDGVYVIKQTSRSDDDKIYFPEISEADVMSLEEGPDADEHAVRELVLFADNDADLYRQSYEPIIKNLQRKVNKGVYDVELAKKLWGYHAERAAKAYAQQHGDGTPWNRMFSPNDRRAAAEQFEQNAREEIGAEELAETQTDDVVHSFQDRQRDEKMKRLSNPRDYFESVLTTKSSVSEMSDDELMESLSAMLEGKSKKDKKTEKEDEKAEKAGKKVAKDIEYDEDHKGKDDDKAEKAGKRVTKDIEYDDKEDRKEKKVSKKTKDAIEHVVIPAQKKEVEKYQVTGRIDPKKFKKEFVNKEMKKIEEQLSYMGEDTDAKYTVWVGGTPEVEGVSHKKALAVAQEWKDDGYDDVVIEKDDVKEDAHSRQYNGDGHADAYSGIEFEDTQSSSGGTITSRGGVTRHTAGGRYAALDTDDENEFGQKATVKKAPSGLGRGRPKKEKEPEYSKMNDPFGRAPKTIPAGSKGKVHKLDDTDTEELDEDFSDHDSMTKNQLHTIRRAVGELESIISSDQELPEWVKAKIAVATDSISKVRDYIESAAERSVEVATGEEGISISEDVGVDSHESPNYRQISSLFNQLYQLLAKDETMSAEEALGHVAEAKAVWEGDEGSFGEGMSEAKGDYSAKKARAGKDIGKPGKQFAKIAKSAGEKYGSKEAGERVAGAVLAKLRKESVKEADVEEGNEFSGELAKAKAMGKKEFEVDGKKYPVKESAKPDFLDMDKDGNKKETMKKAVADKEKGKKELDEKAVSKKQQKFMGMVHAAQKGEKPASPEVAKAAKSMTKKAATDYAATKHKGLPEKVKEEERDNVMDIPNTAGAAHTQTKPGSNKDGIVFGGSIYEQFDEQLEQLITESLSVNQSMSTDESGEAHQTLSITATDEDATKLADVLRLAGIQGGGASVAQVAQPAEVVVDKKPEVQFDVRDFCPVCDRIPCGCDEMTVELEEADVGKFIVINLQGKVIGRFKTEDEAHECADDYGNKTGNYAYVETEELNEADAPVSDNEPDWPTNQETSDDALQYSGGLNKPKSTGQTTIPVIASQLNRQHSMEESVDLERSLFQTWKNYKG